MYYRLEALRGVAACWVALHHSPFLLHGAVGAFVGSAYLFVDFFFILSGFVMTHAYRERIANGLSFSSYASLRIARLLPLHVFAHLTYAAFVLAKWLLFALGLPVPDPGEYVHTGSFWTNLFLLQAFGVYDYLYWNRPSWSISTELVAYGLFFLLTVTADRRGRILPPLLVAVALYAGLLLGDDRRLDITYDFGLLRCLAGFYLGSALFRWRQRRGALVRAPWRVLAEWTSVFAIALCVGRASHSNAYVLGAIVAFAVAVLVFAEGAPRQPEPARAATPGAATLGPATLGPATLGAATAGAAKSGWRWLGVGWILDTALLRKLGLWSYSIYLLHLVIFESAGDATQFVFDWDPEALGLAAVGCNLAVLALVVGVSKYTFAWIEKPFRDWMKARVARGVPLPSPALAPRWRAPRSTTPALAAAPMPPSVRDAASQRHPTLGS